MIKKIFLFGILIFAFNSAFSQDADSVAKAKPKVALIEHPPVFPGGLGKFYEYISKKLKYPREAYMAKQEGKVLITFVVDKEGAVVDVNVVRGVSPEIDAEAIRVVQNSPKWEPGYQDGKAVRVKYNVNVNFSLAGR